MRNVLDFMTRVAIALWFGAHLAVGYVAVPLLFARLEKEHAGRIAGDLFVRMDWLAMACGALLLLIGLVVCREQFLRCWRNRLVIVLLLLVAVQHFYFQPEMAALKVQAADVGGVTKSETLRPVFARWHAISSSVYLLQSALGLVLVAGLCARAPVRRGRGEATPAGGNSWLMKVD